MRFLVGTLCVLTACSEYTVSQKPATQGLEPEDDTPVAEVPGDPGDPGANPGDDPGAGDGIDPNGDTGGLRGRVCAPDGSSYVAAADVEIQHAGGVAYGVTDGDGWFEVTGLADGPVTVIVTKGSFSVTFGATVVAGVISELPSEECIEQGATDIAVLTGQYDHIEDILTQVGLTYDVYDGIGPGSSTAFLRDPGLMAQYDVLFFNCGMSEAWIQHDAEVAQNVRTFVENGGSVYASDWAYYLVEASFRDQNTFHGNDLSPGDAFVGDAGMVQADVLDPGMQLLLGSNQALINYDLGAWAAMVSADYADPLLTGTYNYTEGLFGGGGQRTAPLASRFTYGQGQVIYTTFHNEQQTTFDMDLLLQDIVLSL